MGGKVGGEEGELEGEGRKEADLALSPSFPLFFSLPPNRAGRYPPNPQTTDSRSTGSFAVYLYQVLCRVSL